MSNMTREQALRVKVGDRLRLDPFWNETTRDPKRRFAGEAEVVAIKEGRSQTGLLFAVKDLGGCLVSLDAGWFLAPEEEG